MDQQFTRKPDVLSEALPDGSMILFDSTTMVAYPVSASGALIWERCTGNRTSGDIVDDLLSVYDASRDRVERDVAAFVDQLVEIGLLLPGTTEAANKQ